MDFKQWLGEDNTLGQDIMKKKYTLPDETFDQWLHRVSGGNEDIKTLIKEKKFLFGGRILANRGLDKLGKKVTISNCYVLKNPEDSIESIFDTAKAMARTYSYSGGCGVNLSNLRPKGSKVNNSAETTTGACSFMGLFNETTDVIGQNGRRGALMLGMNVNHPDIVDFINSKNDLTKVNKANISVMIGNDFMEKVLSDGTHIMKFDYEDGTTLYKTIIARDLLRMITQNMWETGEPGILFWDTIQQNSLMSAYKNYYEFVNPCGELPLTAWGACCLASMVLSNYYNKDTNWFDFEAFEEDVKKAIRALDEVVEEGMHLHPLKEQQEAVKDFRPLGLGVMGYADLLIKIGIEYGSLEGNELLYFIKERMFSVAFAESVQMAKEKGPFRKYYADLIRHQSFVDLDDEGMVSKQTKADLLQYGLRNAQLLAVAPTGSISTMLEVSPAAEPLFALEFTRKTESLHGEDVFYTVRPKIVSDYMKTHNIESIKELPEFFKCAHDIHHIDRIETQANAQVWVDNAISSTINLPHDATVKDIEELIIYAYKQEIKGLTVFRDGCSRAGVLMVKEETTKCKCGFELIKTEGCAICPSCGDSPCK
jgi:ribonucleoside-diphosphate reductase alpha chain